MVVIQLRPHYEEFPAKNWQGRRSTQLENMENPSPLARHTVRLQRYIDSIMCRLVLY